MTLLSDLIEIPTQVHKTDFVISLPTAIHDPAQTIKDYVVTPQLVQCFDRALSLVTSAVTDHRSKSAFLHSSFGGGKTAMMAVLHLLLNGDPGARAIPELAPVVGKYADRLEGKRFLLVPYHFVAKASMEQEVLGGYVEYMARLHPGSAPAPVYLAQGILDDAQRKRRDLGDELFFRVLSEGEVEDDWGEYGGGWDAARFDKALNAMAGSSEWDQLVGALLRTHHAALPGQAQATAQGFVPIGQGLDAISRHAKGLGYDAVILFLDDLVLWLASRMADVAFVSREGAKLVKLVEADAGARPAPIVGLIAKQKDLRELVGEHVPGADSLDAIDIFKYSQGRFDTIALEDRNLPAIAERRLLRPRTEQARQLLDDAFEQVRQGLEARDERDVLLTETGDLAAFRRLYPFSPALVDALVALSGAMQRERTALRVMLQLLVNARDHLQLGELIPLGDLWDVISTGDEPLTEVMRAQFAQARRLWAHRFEPMLLRDHNLDEDQAAGVPPAHAYRTDARLVKSLLVAALVPEVGPLRGLTVSRLTALNSGIVRAFVPGTERPQVLDKLRRWQAEVGELRLGEDEQDPTVGVVLLGIDTGPILEAAKAVDSSGERRRRVRELLTDMLQVKDPASLDPSIEVTWRGTRRKVAVVFANVRDHVELPDEMLRSGTDPRLVIDYPFDVEGFAPTDDRSRILDHRRDRPAEWTAAWLPNFFSKATEILLGKLVRLEYALKDEPFGRLASYMPPADRAAARAQLTNEHFAVGQRVRAALHQAYGVDPAQQGVLQDGLPLGDQFLSLDPGLALRPPVGTSIRTCAEGLADQLLRHRYPKHPELTELAGRADLTHTLNLVTRALGQPNGRLENVEPPPMRRLLARVAPPLQLGTMYQAHFVADLQHWKDLVERRRSEVGVTAMTVGQLRRWLDGADTPAERRGLTAEIADLLILLVAAATNRVMLSAGQPVARPEIGKLRDDWELKPQELPNPEAWLAALQRAGDMGIIATSTLLSATSVADLGRRIHERLGTDAAQGARDLVPRLEGAYARVGLGADADRLRTALAAVELLDGLRRRVDNAPEVLAACAVPTTAAGLGTSIVQAQAVAEELSRTNWELIRSAIEELPEPWAVDARVLRDRLVEALVADELAVGLVARLRQATNAATDLVRRALGRPAVAPPPPAVTGMPGVSPPVNAPAEPSAGPSEGPPAGGLTREVAEERLRELKDRLRRESRLELTWEIRDLAHGDG